MHDEISGWVNTEGEEKEGIIEERWLNYNDGKDGTTWVDEKGEQVKLRKATYLNLNELNETNFYNLLPEYWLRPYEPKFITKEELEKEILLIKKEISSIK
jgi:hypothetical protein